MEYFKMALNFLTSNRLGLPASLLFHHQAVHATDFPSPTSNPQSMMDLFKLLLSKVKNTYFEKSFRTG